MIYSFGIQIRFVGANCVRPLWFINNFID